jgi:hypothetical protein
VIPTTFWDGLFVSASSPIKFFDFAEPAVYGRAGCYSFGSEIPYDSTAVTAGPNVSVLVDPVCLSLTALSVAVSPNVTLQRLLLMYPSI